MPADKEKTDTDRKSVSIQFPAEADAQPASETDKDLEKIRGLLREADPNSAAAAPDASGGMPSDWLGLDNPDTPAPAVEDQPADAQAAAAGAQAAADAAQAAADAAAAAIPAKPAPANPASDVPEVPTTKTEKAKKPNGKKAKANGKKANGKKANGNEPEAGKKATDNALLQGAEEKAEKVKKEAEEKADKLKKDAEEKADKLKKDAEKKADKLKKDAEKKAEKTVSEGKEAAAEITYSSPNLPPAPAKPTSWMSVILAAAALILIVLGIAFVRGHNASKQELAAANAQVADLKDQLSKLQTPAPAPAAPATDQAPTPAAAPAAPAPATSNDGAVVKLATDRKTEKIQQKQDQIDYLYRQLADKEVSLWMIRVNLMEHTDNPGVNIMRRQRLRDVQEQVVKMDQDVIKLQAELQQLRRM
jgi:vacuolar-type H+-ATPase subunit H